jgi:diguanylate cyclase (GGDEF)-like protein
MNRANEKYDRLEAELRGLFEKARLPTSPAVANRILQLIHDPDSTVRQFGEAIESDPALAARLLRMANSPRYAQRASVTSIQRAVTVLGVRQLRVVALGFELVGHLNKLGESPFDLAGFWERSVLRACLAREIARRAVPALADEAFLVGLLQDCGILMLVQTLGKSYADLCLRRTLSPTALFDAERSQFPYTHADAVGTLARMWNLPPTIADALRRHHEHVTPPADAGDEDRLVAVGYLVGSLGFEPDAVVAQAEPVLQEFAREALGLDDAALRLCLDTAGEIFADFSGILEGVRGDVDVTELILEANRQLQHHSLNSEQRIAELAVDRERILHEQRTLRSALGQYREQAAQDPLTGLLNRGALLAATTGCIRRLAQKAGTIAVLFMDLDDFKQVNDRFGHHVGDEVLKAVSVIARDVVGNAGFVGRYGGEEFVIVLSGLSEDESRDLAEGLSLAIRRQAAGQVAGPARITCSVGAVWCRLPRTTSAEVLFNAADELMYDAKRDGKDCCRFRALPGSEARTPPDGPPREDAEHDEPALLVRSGLAPTEEEFRRVAEAIVRTGSGWLANDRKIERRNLMTAGRLLTMDRAEVTEEDVFVCNVSTGGLGLLVGRPLQRGNVVEAIIEGDGRTMHVGGVVAFCRHVVGTIHEVGVQSFQRDTGPILDRSGEALSDLDWVARFLGPPPGESDARQSA